MEPVPDIAPDIANIRADRSLLLPGPFPPLSHLGATVFRHSVHAALRFALYNLGQPVPDSPPVRFVSLRPYFDAPKLRKESERDKPLAREVLGALIDPGGIAERRLSKRLTGTLWFHRRRLAIKTRLTRSERAPATQKLPEAMAGTAQAVHARLSTLLPFLGEALLAELLTSLDRREHRRRGNAPTLVQSREAARFLDGTAANLSRLGLPDPRVPSWLAEAPSRPDTKATAALECPSHRLRGSFREQYRLTLDHLRPHLVALGLSAERRGFIESAEDIFFLPLDLLGDLELDTKPDWLEGSIASNRSEWQELLDRGAPADTLGNVRPTPRVEIAPELSPLTPLV